MNSSLRFAAIAMALTFTASASTLYVAPTGNDTTAQADDPGLPYKTVNAAITAAVAGDTVSIAAGTYKESKTWTIDKAITIRATSSDPSQTVIAGQRVIPPEMQRQVEEVAAFASLSDRQLAFLELAARGFSNEDIVRQHKTTIDAVKKQFSAIFQKLGVTNRAEAVAYAQRKHLLKT